MSVHVLSRFVNYAFFFFRTIFANFEEYDEFGDPRSSATIYNNATHKVNQRDWLINQEKPPKEVDHFFLLIMSIIIFFMQCGFAFMEAGAVR